MFRGFRNLAIGLTALASAATLQVASADDDADCHPSANPDVPQFILGYGSLLESQSRTRTWPSAGDPIPANIAGFQRAFNTTGASAGYSTTFLGVSEQDDAELYAALFAVNDLADFAAGDAREYPYCRVAVDASQITTLDDSSLPADAEIWMYAVKPEHIGTPTAEYPLIQSYIDLFLNGCIQLQELVVDQDLDFLAACINSTDGWSRFWVNDRIHPRRPSLTPNALHIDRTLNDIVPTEFSAIVIE
ncbi:MAG: gamma-glutamylcyclotransferase family protein [Pseudomonadota bacterium]